MLSTILSPKKRLYIPRRLLRFFVDSIKRSRQLAGLHLYSTYRQKHPPLHTSLFSAGTIDEQAVISSPPEVTMFKYRPALIIVSRTAVAVKSKDAVPPVGGHNLLMK